MTFDRRGRGPRMLGMMGIVLLFAAGFSAIKSPSLLGAQSVAIASVAVVVVASFGAVLCVPKAFWFGFAAVGWASLLLASPFWLDEHMGPWVLGAAIFQQVDPTGYQDSIRRFPFGMTVYRMAVFPQIALAQALIGGGIAVAIRRLFPGERRFGWRAAVLGGIVALVSSALAIRFRDTVVFFVYVQAVTIALAAVTLGAFVGGRRRECAAAAAIGWCSLGWCLLVTNPDSHHRKNSFPVGPSESLFTLVYPEILDSDGSTSERLAGWRDLLLGDAPSVPQVRRSGGSIIFPWGWDWWTRSPFLRFQIVLQHAMCLILMGIAGVAAVLVRDRLRRK